jgi:hypothetical protein
MPVDSSHLKKTTVFAIFSHDPSAIRRYQAQSRSRLPREAPYGPLADRIREFGFAGACFSPFPRSSPTCVTSCGRTEGRK